MHKMFFLKISRAENRKLIGMTAVPLPAQAWELPLNVELLNLYFRIEECPVKPVENCRISIFGQK